MFRFISLIVYFVVSAVLDREQRHGRVHSAAPVPQPELEPLLRRLGALLVLELDGRGRGRVLIELGGPARGQRPHVLRMDGRILGRAATAVHRSVSAVCTVGRR